ncbi:hypothetical protein C8R47DRAFT_408836 [Mycena vitilis]|nr:hypothetical protein C8R47DRAFT_408836 [Mycena vitilis]
MLASMLNLFGVHRVGARTEHPYPDICSPYIPQPTTAEKLALCTDTLTSVHGDKQHLAGQTSKRRAALQGVFGTEKHTSRYADIAKAVATICNATPGQDNFSVMLGYSNTEMHLFFSQDGGPAEDTICAHLQSVSTILQEIRDATKWELGGAPAVCGKKDGLVKQVTSKISGFVAAKAIHRGRKRRKDITLLYQERASWTVGLFATRLLQAVYMVALTAETAYLSERLRTETSNLLDVGGSKYTTLPFAVDTTSSEWNTYLEFVQDLYFLAQSKNYTEAAASLQKAAQALPEHKFDLIKCIEKMIEVHKATVTLINVALSPRRSWFVSRKLIVHPFPVPPPEPISISLTTRLWTDWYPANSSFGTVTTWMRGVAGFLVIQFKVTAWMCKIVCPTDVQSEMLSVQFKSHSECYLAIRVAENVEKIDPEITLFPYMASSKPHCVACYRWFEAYNQLGAPAFPQLAYDASHGRLKPGWRPPSLQDPVLHETLLEKVLARMERIVEDSKFLEWPKTIPSKLPECPREILSNLPESRIPTASDFSLFFFAKALLARLLNGLLFR